MFPFTTLTLHSVLLSDAGLCIELLYRPSFPSAWVVRTSRRFLGVRFGATSVWFTEKEKAVLFGRRRAEDKRRQRMKKRP